jgi:hypothetical protein
MNTNSKSNDKAHRSSERSGEDPVKRLVRTDGEKEKYLFVVEYCPTSESGYAIIIIAKDETECEELFYKHMNRNDWFGEDRNVFISDITEMRKLIHKGSLTTADGAFFHGISSKFSANDLLGESRVITKD